MQRRSCTYAGTEACTTVGVVQVHHSLHAGRCFLHFQGGVLWAEDAGICVHRAWLGAELWRPPIIHGDVSRPKAMTVKEFQYAQSLTQKPVKGMLTGRFDRVALHHASGVKLAPFWFG